LEKKQNKYLNVQKDLCGDQLEKNVFRRDNKKAKVKEKVKQGEEGKVLLGNQQARIIK